MPDVLALLGPVLGSDVRLRYDPPSPDGGVSPAASPAVARGALVPSPRPRPAWTEVPVHVRGARGAVLAVEQPLPADVLAAWAPALDLVADLIGLALTADARGDGDGDGDADRDGGREGDGDDDGARGGGRGDRGGVEAAVQVVVAEEEERGALAGHLHDTVVNGLVATRYLADLAAAADDATPFLEPLREALRAALADSRAVMRALRPVRPAVGEAACLLDHLVDALEALTDPAGAPVLVEVDPALDEAALSGLCMPAASVLLAHRFAQAALAAPVPPAGPPTEGGVAVRLGLAAPHLLVVSVPPADLAAPALRRVVARIRAVGGDVRRDAGGTHALLFSADRTVTADAVTPTVEAR